MINFEGDITGVFAALLILALLVYASFLETKYKSGKDIKKTKKLKNKHKPIIK